MTTQFTSHAADLSEPTDVPVGSPTDSPSGGDYSPEQWPEDVWLEDVALMRRAGVNSVNLGVFSWGLLEIADGRVRVRLARPRHGPPARSAASASNLATPTAAPPIWLHAGASGDPRRSTSPAGARSPGRAARVVPELCRPSGRYALRIGRVSSPSATATHPALKLWHVSNEIGNENARCYSDETAVAWQAWLVERYSDVDGAQRGVGNGILGSPLHGLRPGAAASPRPTRSTTRDCSSISSASPPTRCSATTAPSATCSANSLRTLRSPPTSWS